MYFQCWWNGDECQKGLQNRDNIPPEDRIAGWSINTTQELGFSRDRGSYMYIELTIKQTKYEVQLKVDIKNESNHNVMVVHY